MCIAWREASHLLGSGTERHHPSPQLPILLSSLRAVRPALELVALELEEALELEALEAVLGAQESGVVKVGAQA